MTRSLLIAALAASSLHVAILAAVGAWRGEGSAGPNITEPLRIAFISTLEGETPSEARESTLEEPEAATHADIDLPEVQESADDPAEELPLSTSEDLEAHIPDAPRSLMQTQPHEPEPVTVMRTTADEARAAQEADVAHIVEMSPMEVLEETAAAVEHSIARPSALLTAMLAQIRQQASAPVVHLPPQSAPDPSAGERTEPVAEHHPRPPYPSVARRRSYEGSVVLLVEVLSDGRVGEVRVSRSSGHDVLDRAALQTVRDRWRFRAGSVGGRTASSWIEIPIEFRLRD